MSYSTRQGTTGGWLPHSCQNDTATSVIDFVTVLLNQLTSHGPPVAPLPHSVAKELLYVALETDLFHFHTAVLTKTVYNVIVLNH